MNIAIVGSGQMGTGIAQVMATFGHTVWLYDCDITVLEQSIESMSRRLDRTFAKGGLPSAPQHILARIHSSVDLTELAELPIDIAIEAIPEVYDLKKELFERLDDLLPAHAVLASNTSSLSITLLAALTRRPAQVVGMHFMHPVPVMELVEIVRGLCTSDETLTLVKQLAEHCGKTGVVVEDQPGFIANRILLPMINEAIFALSEGVADVAGIDTIIKLGMNHPMGPLALADFIGLDTCLSILEILHEGFGDSKYRAAPLLRRMVIAGRLGKKSLNGFYRYSPDGERLAHGHIFHQE